MSDYFVLDYTLSEKEKQDSFIYWAVKKVFVITSPPEPTYYAKKYRAYHARFTKFYVNNDRKAMIHELYTEGFYVYKVLSMSFEDFYNAIVNQTSYYPGYLERKYRGFGSFWYDLHGVDFRQSLKYVRNKNHKPKEQTQEEDFKSQWRDRKGFTKDHRRRNRSAYGGRKTRAKKDSNRSYRRWTKNTITKGDYEKFYKTKDRHYFDPWDWD